MRWAPVFLALLLAAPAWAAICYVDSADGDDADDCSTWALADATLSAAVTAINPSTDVIYVADDHAESTTGSLTLSNASDSVTAPVVIYSVDRDNSDAYLPGALAQVTRSGVPDDITFDGHFRIHGVYFKTEDNIVVQFNAANSFWAEDATFEMTTNGSIWQTQSAGAEILYLKNSTINFSNASGGKLGIDDRLARFDGVTFSGDLVSAGLFTAASASDPTRIVCTGCDMSAYTSETLVDFSFVNTYFQVELIGSLLPATVTLHDSGFNAPYPTQYLYLSGTDDGTGNESFRSELYTLQGDVTTDTSVYHDAGAVFTEGTTNASIKFAPAAGVADWPLCSWPTYEWINTTGSKTFTTELVENYTSALTEDDFWQEIFYLGTAGSPEWSLDVGASVLSSTALTAGTGCANWTGEPATCNSVKLTTTVTVNKAGIYQIRWCTNAFESGKVIHVDPKPTIS